MMRKLKRLQQGVILSFQGGLRSSNFSKVFQRRLCGLLFWGKYANSFVRSGIFSGCLPGKWKRTIIRWVRSRWHMAAVWLRHRSFLFFSVNKFCLCLTLISIQNVESHRSCLRCWKHSRRFLVVPWQPHRLHEIIVTCRSHQGTFTILLSKAEY